MTTLAIPDWQDLVGVTPRGSGDVDTVLEAEPCDECASSRWSRLVRVARIVAGVASLAAAAWWTVTGLITWWRTRPAIDADYGLRFTPLSPADTAAARAREAELDAAVRV